MLVLEKKVHSAQLQILLFFKQKEKKNRCSSGQSEIVISLVISDLDWTKMSGIQNAENLNPQVMRLIGKEIQSLKIESMEGISVVLDDKDLTRVEAVIDGPADTPYFGGKFRVKLSIGKDFPAAPPKGQ